MENNPFVSFPLKELLEDIRRKVEKIDEKLDMKADRSEILHLAEKIDLIDRAGTKWSQHTVEKVQYLETQMRSELTSMQQDVKKLSDEKVGRDAVDKWRKWFIGAVIALAGSWGLQLITLLKHLLSP